MTPEERIVLAVERGGVQVITPPGGSDALLGPNTIEGGPAIAQLVVGSEAPQETVAMAGMTLRGEARRLIDVLIPPAYPQMDNQAL